MATVMNDTYHSLLMDYAAGSLDEAYSLLVASHLALSPEGRKIVAGLETVGGGLLENCCEPVAMKSSALSDVLAKLDQCGDARKKECDEQSVLCQDMKRLPKCLRGYIEIHNEHIEWTSTSERVHTIAIKTPTCCQRTRAHLIKIGEGANIPHHGRMEYRAILVIDGTIETATSSHRRGEIVFLDGAGVPYQTANDTNSLCLAISYKHSLLDRFLNSFRH